MSKVVKAKYTDEAVAGFNHRTAMEEAARCLLCIDAPCSKGCPAGTDPGNFIRSIRFRNVKGAAEIIRENNVLGGSCARVCPYDRLCEEYCSRCGIDRPIEIGKLQRYAVEQEKLHKMKILKAGKAKKAKVACVGSGPASLACAAKLAQEGYAVTIFEAQDKAGGVLTYGITPARLPQSVVDFDIKSVKDLGVKFVFNCKVGEDITLEELKKAGFRAIFIGAGLWASKIPAIPGNNLGGVYTAVDFLKQARDSKGKFDPGKNVVVIGLGDVAMDCATTAKLLGAEKVMVYYRRSLEEAPASMDEIQYAISLGVTITTNFAPAELIGDKHVEIVMFNGRDGVSGAKVKADTVVFAIGQEADEIEKIAAVKLADKGTIAAKANGKTNIAGIFAAGDVVNGGKTVVEAVAAGKEAAAEIVKYLEKKVGAK